MPASTLDILHSDWENQEKIIDDLKLSSSKIGAVFYENNGEIQVHKNYQDRSAELILEIESDKSLEWYYKQYPSAKLEPESRIPYFVFDSRINGKDKLLTIVTSNCYLDSEMIYDFFKEYLSINKEKFIYIDKSIWFGINDIEKVESEGGYRSGWYNNLTRSV